MFGILAKADRIENVAVVFKGRKAALAHLNCKKFFSTSALSRTGVEEPLAAAELFARRDADATPETSRPANPRKECLFRLFDKGGKMGDFLTTLRWRVDMSDFLIRLS
jgi:hypothetical protein